MGVVSIVFLTTCRNLYVPGTCILHLNVPAVNCGLRKQIDGRVWEWRTITRGLIPQYSQHFDSFSQTFDNKSLSWNGCRRARKHKRANNNCQACLSITVGVCCVVLTYIVVYINLGSVSSAVVMSQTWGVCLPPNLKKWRSFTSFHALLKKTLVSKQSPYSNNSFPGINEGG